MVLTGKDLTSRELWVWQKLRDKGYAAPPQRKGGRILALIDRHKILPLQWKRIAEVVSPVQDGKEEC